MVRKNKADARSDKNLSFSLPQVLDLLAAQGLKDKLLEFFDLEGDLLIEGSDVERISTPCIEVLVAAQKAFKNAERAFQIKNPSEYLSEAFETLGLGTDLDQWRIS
ncbi:STAS domain-containing protein [Kordiimonas pumila]|uniref:Lipid asymmetry maintenance protein MlaB n=1 Tax=Kordiimonas pumila TaxID=2161677 RepID=A0ABV7D1F0_9PROT|nr:STAS domain-containing protein [Kordiimonas pumila]